MWTSIGQQKTQQQQQQQDVLPDRVVTIYMANEHGRVFRVSQFSVADIAQYLIQLKSRQKRLVWRFFQAGTGNLLTLFFPTLNGNFFRRLLDFCFFFFVSCAPDHVARPIVDVFNT